MGDSIVDQRLIKKTPGIAERAAAVSFGGSAVCDRFATEQAF
jgi:hypothetical protein